MADTSSLRSRPANMAASDRPSSAPGSHAPATTRSPPHLPTPLESVLFLVYPAILVFGSVFSVLNPQTRAAPYDATGQSHVQAQAPSYFARKDNLFNTLFVKRGWAWVTGAFVVFLLTHPELARSGTRRAQAALRWVLVTTWWVLVTQWCFGPALIDRGFRFTGGRCEVAREAVAEGFADRADVFTAVACRAAGGRWRGGHDISGHVFLLVLGSWFLIQEVGWILVRAGELGRGRRDDRCVIMSDGAVKGAGVEAQSEVEGAQKQVSSGLGAKFALAVISLSLWMLLMTAIYFHTWFEKLTGLLVALIGIYGIYFFPRLIPALRSLIGLPGI